MIKEEEKLSTKLVEIQDRYSRATTATSELLLNIYLVLML